MPNIQFFRSLFDAYLNKALLTPGTIVPKGRIHGPAAALAYFGEGPNVPGPGNLATAPGTITHKAH